MIFAVKGFSLLLGSAMIVSVAHTAEKLTDKQVIGTWEAIKIVDSSSTDKNHPPIDRKDLLASYSIQFKPNHRFFAQFSVPLEGSWKLKGQTIMILPDNPKPETGPQGSGFSMSITFSPSPISVSPDRKTLTRRVETQTETYRRKA